jgi:hypothetical protein
MRETADVTDRAGAGGMSASRRGARTELARRLAVAACLAATGYLHTDLYLGAGYRSIPVVGPSFLVLASGCFAVAVLLPVADPPVPLLGAAVLAVGALLGFVASRTIGIDGFVEQGLQPAPQGLLSLLLETAVLVLLVAPHAAKLVRTPREAAE